MSTKNPTAITVHNKSKVLDIAFDDGASFTIPFELMRVYSPSAEVMGHGPGQEVKHPGATTVFCPQGLRLDTAHGGKLGLDTQG